MPAHPDCGYRPILECSDDCQCKSAAVHLGTFTKPRDDLMPVFTIRDYVAVALAISIVTFAAAWGTQAHYERQAKINQEITYHGN